MGNRIAWIDNVRLFAILCVMFGHCCFCIDPNALNGYEVFGYRLQRDFIVSFNMPLFVFLSGFCAYKGIERIVSFNDLLGYWLKITKRIAVPMLCFNSLLSIIGNIQQGDIIGVAFWMSIIAILGFIHWMGKREKYERFKWVGNVLLYAVLLYEFVHLGFWFLNMLLQIMVIVSAIWYIKKLIDREWTIIPLIIIAYIVVVLIKSGARTEEFLGYFIAGVLFNRYGVVEKVFKHVLWLLPLAIGGVLLVPVVSGCDFYSVSLFDLIAENKIYLFILRQLCAFIWILFFYLFFRAVSKKYLKISTWGGQTLPMYLIHAVLLEWFRSKIHFVLGSDFVLWGQLVLMFIVLVLITCMFIWIFEKNECTRVLLLGENK